MYFVRRFFFKQSPDERERKTNWQHRLPVRRLFVSQRHLVSRSSSLPNKKRANTPLPCKTATTAVRSLASGSDVVVVLWAVVGRRIECAVEGREGGMVFGGLVVWGRRAKTSLCLSFGHSPPHPLPSLSLPPTASRVEADPRKKQTDRRGKGSVEPLLRAYTPLLLVSTTPLPQVLLPTLNRQSSSNRHFSKSW